MRPRYIFVNHFDEIQDMYPNKWDAKESVFLEEVSDYIELGFVPLGAPSINTGKYTDSHGNTTGHWVSYRQAMYLPRRKK